MQGNRPQAGFASVACLTGLYCSCLKSCQDPRLTSSHLEQVWQDLLSDFATDSAVFYEPNHLSQCLGLQLELVHANFLLLHRLKQRCGHQSTHDNASVQLRHLLTGSSAVALNYAVAGDIWGTQFSPVYLEAFSKPAEVF